MTSLCDEVRHRIPPNCIVTRCRKEGCSVSLQEAPEPFLVIDVDKGAAGADETNCDYILIGCADRAWVVALELKRGNAEADTVVRQLRAGARAASRVIPPGVRLTFLPVVASGGIKRAQRDLLRRSSNRISFRGKKEYVRRIRCGERLASVLGV